MLDAPGATCYADRMLRLAILVSLITTACGGGSRGPAWPKTTERETDGGESLTPRVAGPLATNDTSDDDVVTVEKPTEKPAAKSSTTDDSKPVETPRPTAPTVTAPDDVINVDDLVIEIDD